MNLAILLCLIAVFFSIQGLTNAVKPAERQWEVETARVVHFLSYVFLVASATVAVISPLINQGVLTR